MMSWGGGDPGQTWGKGVPGRKNSKYTGIEAGTSPEHLRVCSKARTSGVNRELGKPVECVIEGYGKSVSWQEV